MFLNWALFVIRWFHSYMKFWPLPFSKWSYTTVYININLHQILNPCVAQELSISTVGKTENQQMSIGDMFSFVKIRHPYSLILFYLISKYFSLYILNYLKMLTFKQKLFCLINFQKRRYFSIHSYIKNCPLPNAETILPPGIMSSVKHTSDDVFSC